MSQAIYKTREGLTKEIVEEISEQKNEPDWMRQLRLKSFEIFKKKPMPTWGVDLSELNFDEITTFIRSRKERATTWEELPNDIKDTFDKLGIPEAEKKYLGGASAMYESEVVYNSIKKELEEKGVIFTDTDTALQKYPELVKEYFMTKCVPPQDNKFSALHGALWSGGSFVYIPKGVKVDMPLQIYFIMASEAEGQFEHTLIVAEEDSQVNYIEGCTAPRYTKASIHSAVVEIFVKKNARVRYTSVQNWSKDVYNLNTKRAIVGERGIMEWVSGTLGSKSTMLYPCSVLAGRGAKADHLSIAFAGNGQWKDTGAKVIHAAPDTSSTVRGKSICMEGGITTYRGLLQVNKGATNSKALVSCDALMLHETAKNNTFPTMKINEEKVHIGHEATVGKLSAEKLFYLMTRGLSEEAAMQMVVSGFIEPVMKELPFEYAVELNRLIQLEMTGSVG